MLLRNLTIQGRTGIHCIRTYESRIAMIAEDIEPWNGEPVIELEGAMVMPGFINSHDHLDFNCYPKLGNRIYKSYREWGPDIHNKNAGEIAAVKKIPAELRTRWGIYKNLLNGFTTVVHHGDPLRVDESLINVIQDQYSLHSTAFEANWKWKINRAPAGQRIVMHIGEGTDWRSRDEITEVARWNLLRHQIVAVHGVAMDAKQAKDFSGLVWCPSSNYFLLDQTADVNELKSVIPIVFGTDSTLTSDWDAAMHFSDALQSNAVTKNELLEMLTAGAAKLWQLKDRGEIRKNAFADLVVVDSNDSNPFDAANYKLIMVNGEIKVIRASISNDIVKEEGYDRIIYKEQELLIKGNIAALSSEIQCYYPALEIPFTQMSVPETYL